MMKKGCLLLEMLIVLALIILVGSLGVMSISWYDRYLVRLEIERLYATIMLVHQSACNTQKPQEIIIQSNENCYRTSYGKDELIKGVLFGVMAGVKGPPSLPVHFLTKPVSFARNCITCYPDGVIDAGTVYLTNKSKSCLYALSCGVAQEPYIRCYYYYQSKWVSLR